MIDLTGHSTLLLSTSFDSLTAAVTLTFKDGTGVTTLGQITMDQARFRPFMDVLKTVAEVYYDSLSTVPQGYRLNFDVNQNQATVAFG
jgi:hypothetical protein